jgi:hypothetical protein
MIDPEEAYSMLVTHTLEKRIEVDVEEKILSRFDYLVGADIMEMEGFIFLEEETTPLAAEEDEDEERDQ